MNTLTQLNINQVNAGQGLSQYHVDEIQASNWPTPFNSVQSTENGERLNWYLASRQQFDRFLVR